MDENDNLTDTRLLPIIDLLVAVKLNFNFHPRSEVILRSKIGLVNAFWRDIPEYKPYLEKFTEATKAPSPAKKSKSPKR